MGKKSEMVLRPYRKSTTFFANPSPATAVVMAVLSPLPYIATLMGVSRTRLQKKQKGVSCWGGGGLAH